LMPLEGIKVVDLTQAAAGPLAGQLLGDMGADVIKVEPLSGDHFRPMMNGSWVLSVNRNKRGLAVDLKLPEGKEIMFNLIKEADVFLQAFVPGTIERLGLGYEDVKKINPRIIYCAVSGYGQSGPNSRRSGYDVCAQAESGLMAATGDEGSPYVRIGSSLIDYCTGVYAAYGIASAILAREKTDKGQFIDICLLDVAISLMGHWITNYSITGENPERMGTGHNIGAPYQVFDTKDRSIYIGILSDKHWKGFCEHLKLHDLLCNPLFSTNKERSEHKPELIPLVQKELYKHTCDELMEILVSLGIPCAPVLKVSEALESPHVKQRNIVVEREYQQFGKVKFPNNPLNMSETPVTIRMDTPQVGEHSVEVLEQLGYEKDKISQLIDKKVILG